MSAGHDKSMLAWGRCARVLSDALGQTHGLLEHRLVINLRKANAREVGRYEKAPQSRVDSRRLRRCPSRSDIFVDVLSALHATVDGWQMLANDTLRASLQLAGKLG